MKHHPRLDANHHEIVKVFEGLGCNVLSLAPLGRGAPDLLVAYKTRSWLVEVKDGSKPPSAQKLKPDQVKFFAKWQGGIHVVNSVDAAIEVFNLYLRDG